VKNYFKFSTSEFYFRINYNFTTTKLINLIMASLGLALFLIVGLMAFWILVFLMGFIIPYWVTLGAMQMLRPKRLVDTNENEKK